MPYRIRQGSFTEDRYLKRDGTWGAWDEAAKFSTQDAAERFVEKHKATVGDNYGIFDYKVLHPMDKRKIEIAHNETVRQRNRDRMANGPKFGPITAAVMHPTGPCSQCGLGHGKPGTKCKRHGKLIRK